MSVELTPLDIRIKTEGILAFHAGKKPVDCPYTDLTSRACSFWNKGWGEEWQLQREKDIRAIQNWLDQNCKLSKDMNYDMAWFLVMMSGYDRTKSIILVIATFQLVIPPPNTL